MRRRLFNFMFYRMSRGPLFKVYYMSGDDAFRPSLHFEWWWFGRNYWLCIWLPG